jgi:hypothetical protein
LLGEDQKLATRFCWLLSDLGTLNPKILQSQLPFLLDYCKSNYPQYKTAFASFWYWVGVPKENEGEAIHFLFDFLLDRNSNITLKSRSMVVLFSL